jgi:hypothetical protein
MSGKLKNEIEITTSFDNLIDENANVVIELTCFVANIKNEVVGVLDYFFSFLRIYEEKNS